jgi:hypothetical protein
LKSKAVDRRIDPKAMISRHDESQPELGQASGPTREASIDKRQAKASTTEEEAVGYK